MSECVEERGEERKHSKRMIGRKLMRQGLAEIEKKEEKRRRDTMWCVSRASFALVSSLFPLPKSAPNCLALEQTQPTNKRVLLRAF